VYGSGGFTTEDDDVLAARLDAWLDAGVGAVKIKIAEDRGRRTDRDLERVAFVRGRVGPDIGVFVDANGGYDVDQAIEMGRELDALGVSWFEEPVSSDDPGGLARVRDAVRADVAAGEYVWRPSDARPLLDGAVDCLQIDVTRCGGITVWPEIVRMAEAASVEVSAHCAPQLAVHIGAATAGLRHLEWFQDHERVDAILFDGTLPVVDGRLTPTDAVGHGMALADRAERYRIR
jgi:L-alanine-DL-glutamate epimerase-like enolase superfamily enzyme